MGVKKFLQPAPSGWLLVFCVAVMTSCSAAPEPVGESSASGVEIAGIKISNRLAYGITDVQILVVDTGAFVACGNIVARSACATSFPLRRYHQNKVRINWKERGQPHSTDDVVLEFPAVLDLQRPAWIDVEVFASGQAGARLNQQKQ